MHQCVRCRSGHHHGFGQTPCVQCSRPIGLEKILARQSATTDGYSGPIGIDHQFFTRKTVIPFWPTTIKCSCAVHMDRRRNCCIKARQFHCQLDKCLLQGHAHGPVQSDIVGPRFLLQ